MGPALHFMRFWKNIYWIQLICYIVLVSGVWHSDLFFVCLFFFPRLYSLYYYYRLLQDIGYNSLWVHAQLLSRVWLFVTPWTGAHRCPFPMGLFQTSKLEKAAISSFGDPANPRLLCLQHRRMDSLSRHHQRNSR